MLNDKKKKKLKKKKGLSKICSVEKVGSPEIGEGIPLKKDRNRWGRGALMLHI